MQLDWHIRNLGSGPVTTYLVRFDEDDAEVFAANGQPQQIEGWVLDGSYVGVVDGVLEVFGAPMNGHIVPWPSLVVANVVDGVLLYYGLRPLYPDTTPLPPFSGNGGGEWPQGDFKLIDEAEPDTWLGDMLSPSDFWLEARKAKDRGRRPFKQRKEIRGS